MAKDQKVYRWNYAAEPTLVKFHACDDFVRALMGPYGSGKSSGCCAEIVLRANRQKPFRGVRRTRWAIVRNTYPELKSTTINTWQIWMPDAVCRMTYGSPIEGRARYPLADGTTVDLHIYFLALDKPKDVKKLLSLELTGVYFNEVREIPKVIFDAASGRVGRYPAKRMGGASWRGIICDTNPPDTDHWFYRLFEVDKPVLITDDGHIIRFRLFKQPGGLMRTADGKIMPNPKAENIQNLDDGYNYYYQQIVGKTDDWIKVYVFGQYGQVMEGKPVYPEYKEELHYPDKIIEPMRGLPMVIGFDFGLNPSAAFIQFEPMGKLVVVDELCSDDMGLRQFVRDIFRPHVMAHYFDMILSIVGDPAGEQKSQTDERTCYQILEEEGYHGQPVYTNAWIPRRDALSKYMLRQDGFAVSAKCKVIRAGLLGKYYYDRVRVVSEDERFHDTPAKNFHSHIMNALEYAAMAPALQQPGTSGGSGKKRPSRRRGTKGWT